MKRLLKHLPVSLWPVADTDGFEKADLPGDIFDETAGPGAHLAEGTRRMIRTAYRRWLGYLSAHYPGELASSPAARITPQRVRTFVDCLQTEVRDTTVAHVVLNLYYAARLVQPESDWSWLRAVGSRLAVRARPQNRFGQLVPPLQTLDFGMKLMEKAANTRSGDRDYRDGLIIAVLSLWPLRRRTVAALRVDRHLVFDGTGISVSLFAGDTKAGRPETWRMPPELVPYFMRYLEEVRPSLLGSRPHMGLWPSAKGCLLTGDRIYNMARKRLGAQFGKKMGLHDFRRAAATFTAIDAPEMLSLIPGLLHHASPDVSEQHYNIASSVAANRRYNTTLTALKAKLAATR